MEISVIVPTFNEELTIKKTLEALARLQNVSEVIVVDGGSTDRTMEIVENFKEVKNLKLIRYGIANRGRQMNEGTRHAAHEIFWFIHADTRPVQGSGRQIKAFMRYKEVVGGSFEPVFAGNSRGARFLTRLYSALRKSGFIYGEAAIFARRETYEKIKGFKPFSVFEDLDFCKRLRRRGRFVYINLPVTTSSRRFENRSFIWTVFKWSLRHGFYWAGVPVRLIAKKNKQLK
ncbi:MAG: TIGR04283 family arsenosugar biosynthesis glycosyltransferase [Pyrinomonadaceae bacterium]